MTQKFFRRPQITERYGLPRSTLYDLMAKGHFPRPVRIGPRSVAWRIEDLMEWERGCAEAQYVNSRPIVTPNN